MSETELEDAEVVGAELATVAHATTPVKASDLVLRLATIKEAMEQAMQRDVDFGVIPGTGSKPTLLKPGAEKLSVLFQLDPQITHEEKWDGNHLTVSAACVIYHAPTGERLGRGEGMASTKERKHAYRKAERVCPECQKPAIIKGKAEFGGGWVCFKKKDGCGAKFPDDDERIVNQEVGEIENPDLPDLWNSVIKMGRKRAFTDAVLLVTGASALFTQDLEANTVPAPVDRAPFGPAATGTMGSRAINAITYLLDGDQNASSKAFATIMERVVKDGKAGEYFPSIVAKAIGIIATELKKKREPNTHAPVLDATEGFGVCECGWRGRPDELEAHIASEAEAESGAEE